MGNNYRSVLASGGGVQPTGDAVEANVLSGKTFSNADGVGKTGTMPNNGAVSGTATPSQPYTIPAGYHNGSGVVTAASTGIPININAGAYQNLHSVSDTGNMPITLSGQNNDYVINCKNATTLTVNTNSNTRKNGTGVKSDGTVADIMSSTASGSVTADVTDYDYVFLSIVDYGGSYTGTVTLT